MDESGPPTPTGDDETKSHQLPPALTQTLFCAVLGALPAGIGITFATEPGTRGAALYGLLVPWSAAPFIGAAGMAWWGRSSVCAKSLANRTTMAAVVGALAYGYAFLVAGGADNAKRWFAFVPLWQWLLLAVPLMRVLRSQGAPPR
jgi:hypothetical protein